MHLRDERGAAAVEFAVVLPLLLLILLGIIEYGLIFYNKQVLTNASREGARFGIVAGERATSASIEQEVSNYLDQKLISFQPSEPTVTTCSMDRDDPGTATCPNSTTTKFGDYLSVEIEYPYDFLLFPKLKKIFSSGNPESSLTLRATTVMRYE
ncbi:TadE/TadG family type IV pilus assembly protein [Geoalkalibacter halelectricus]|uniref:TadE/TadG family type IV pilus assembly protein n=1 Tax=Geoalkalibacter halelectricus TaxID=2847045 RepID=UPI003D2554EA